MHCYRHHRKQNFSNKPATHFVALAVFFLLVRHVSEVRTAGPRNTVYLDDGKHCEHATRATIKR